MSENRPFRRRDASTQVVSGEDFDEGGAEKHAKPGLATQLTKKDKLQLFEQDAL